MLNYSGVLAALVTWPLYHKTWQSLQLSEGMNIRREISPKNLGYATSSIYNRSLSAVKRRVVPKLNVPTLPYVKMVMLLAIYRAIKTLTRGGGGSGVRLVWNRSSPKETNEWSLTIVDLKTEIYSKGRLANKVKKSCPNIAKKVA